MREFSKTISTAVLSVALICTSASSAISESLADALAGAYGHSGLLDQNRALLRAADEDVAIASAALRPIINWQASLERSFGQTNSRTTGFRDAGIGQTSSSIGISGQLTLYDGGANRLAVDAAKEAVLATRQGLLSLEQQVLQRAVEAFMNLRREYENVALRENNLRLLREELRAARDRFEVGEVTRTDVALAEARLASAQSSLAAARGSLAAQAEEFAAVVGRKPANVVAPAAVPRTEPNLETARAFAVRNHPDMRRAQHEVMVAELNVKRAEAAMSPTLSLNAGIQFSERGPSRNSTQSGNIGFQAQGPIYQGGALSALLRQSIARRDASRGALHNTRHLIRQNVGVAFAQLKVAQASRSASAQQVRAARVAFQGVREEAKLGARTTLDVLETEQELLNARAGQISAVVDEYIAAYRLLASMGLLTAESLKLNVKRYDPTEYYNLVKTAPVRSRQGEKLDQVLKSLGKQ